MKENIFEVKDKTGRLIHLSKKQWKHITSVHPYMASRIEDIKTALTKTTMIVVNKYDNTRYNYYLYFKEIKRYLLVGVKYLNGSGFITTAFIARNIKKR